MNMLITVILSIALSVLLFWAVLFFWSEPPEQALSGARADIEFQAEAAPFSADWDPHALSNVHHRMDVLAAELERLERDHSVFARAFRTHVAKSAYAALLADAARLAEVSRLAQASRADTTMTIEMELPSSSSPVREVLDI